VNTELMNFLGKGVAKQTVSVPRKEVA
jgi:hypothetical protein